MTILEYLEPATIQVGPGRRARGDRPSVSGIYRNAAAGDGELPTDFRGCKTTYETFTRSEELYGDRKCLGWRPVLSDGSACPYEFLTYSEARLYSERAAAALSSAGLLPGGRLGIYSINSVEHMLLIRAADAMSVACVPMYDSLGPDAVEFVAEHAELEVAAVAVPKLEAFAGMSDAAIRRFKRVVVLGRWDESPERDLRRVLEGRGGAGKELPESGPRASSEGSDGSLAARAGPRDGAATVEISVVGGGGGGTGAAGGAGGAAGGGAKPGAEEGYGVAAAPRGGAGVSSSPAPVDGSSDCSVSAADAPVFAKASAAVARLRSLGVTVEPFSSLLSRGRAARASWTPTPPSPETTACVMYTSGTTGDPKGVVHAHRSIVAAVRGADTLIETCKLPVTEADCMISYLPLAHIFDRVLEELVLALAAHVGYWRGEISGLLDDLAALRPTVFIAVPRVLERVCDGVKRKVAAGSRAKRATFRAALAWKSALLRAGLPRAVAGAGADRLVFSKIAQAMGGRVRFIVSGGAALAPHVEDFVNAAMAPLLQGYGLTETSAATFVMLPDSRLAHSVGPPLHACEFRLESVPEMGYDALAFPPRGEVLVRGPLLFKGYYKNPELTAEAFDDDGFFHTGDVGEITPHGALKLIDRKKNIFKLSQGEYIAVEYVENTLTARLDDVEQLWIYGEPTEATLVAIAVPHPAWIQAHGGKDKLLASQGGNQGGNATILDGAGKKGSAALTAAVLASIKAAAKEAKLRGYEVPKALRLELEAWTPESGLLTPSLKLKRPQLKARYAKEIADMYAEINK